MSDLSDALNMLIERNDVIEIRGFLTGRSPRKSEAWQNEFAKSDTIAGYFNDAAKATHYVQLLDREDTQAIYVTINPVNQALLNRATNRFKPAKQTTTDRDITRRHFFPLDIDAIRPSGISATAAEKDEAKNLMKQLYQDMKKSTWPDPVVIDSGNGYQLWYPVDFPNTEKTTEQIRRTLEGLSERYNTDTAEVDVSVSNAARIMKLPGTHVRKGDHTDERPHRLSTILHNGVYHE